MSKKINIFFLFTGFFIILSLLTISCGEKKVPEDDDTTKEKVLIVAMSGDIGTFDPCEPITAQTIANGYSRLFGVGGISYFLFAMTSLASSDQISVIDEQTIKMTLNVPNRLFHLNNVIHTTSAVHKEDMSG